MSHRLSVFLVVFGLAWCLLLLHYTVTQPRRESSAELRQQILELSHRYVKVLSEENQNPSGPHGTSMAGYADLKRTIAVLLDDILSRLVKLEGKVEAAVNASIQNISHPAAGAGPLLAARVTVSRSRSRRHSNRHYSRSRSHSHRKKSRSRSYSPEYRRRRSQSTSPMSNRRRHTGSRANPDPNTCLGVFGLSLYTTERDLREVFSRYGPLAGVNVVYDQRTGRSRGFAFVYFEHIDDAKEAMERANGMELDGRRIRVDYSITKRPHTPTPGIYMGRPTQRDSYYDRGYDRYDRYDEYDYRYSRRRSPSPYYSRYRSRSRSRSYSPRRY
ncbi:transformer-2 -like protein [Labeo rohita]|uniref:Transformer-2 protein homolog beta n=1 Tax=Labeo rohita TaxID=84645 RepID=A0A498N3P9_LABRO|nr:transformer-2 -like protein [Labeo rohita]